MQTKALKQRTTNIWADNLTLVAFSKAFGINIYTLNSIYLNWTNIYPENTEYHVTVYLLYWEDSHYDSTILYRHNIKDKSLAKKRSGFALGIFLLTNKQIK